MKTCSENKIASGNSEQQQQQQACYYIRTEVWEMAARLDVWCIHQSALAGNEKFFALLLCARDSSEE
jgi:hypothetical protein